MASRTFVALLAARASSFVAPSQRRNVARVVATRASAADHDALSARLGDKSVVENMFIGPDGEPRQFLRREQFTTKLVQAAGPALSEDAAYECWLGFGGAPKPQEKVKEDKGFFGNFMTSIAENAAGGQAEKIDKDMWGNPDLKNIMTIIDINLIMQQDAAADGFSAAALEKQFAAAAKDA